MKLSAVLIAYNEEANIQECLGSAAFADEIVLVDSGSTDRTLERAGRYSPHIFRNPFKDFASQKNFALARASGDWVFFIDADERVPEALAREIRELANVSGPDRVYAVKRLTYFFAKRLRFSGTQDDYPVRLFPRGKVHFEQPVHERVVTTLPVRKLKNALVHKSTRDFDHYKQKLNQYIPLELEVMSVKKTRATFFDLFLRPAAKFFMLYIWKGGLLDGMAGLQYSLLSSYYDFLKYRKFLRLDCR